MALATSGRAGKGIEQFCESFFYYTNDGPIAKELAPFFF
jgi:hypothetical protein